MLNNSPEIRELIDPLGRRITYLRVSLTESCNFTCQYCLSHEDGEMSKAELLNDEEIITLIKVFRNLGINKIRLTGGEPLLRRGLIKLVSRISSIDGISVIGLTTNGYFLANKIEALVEAGLNRLNISLDTLNRAMFKEITGLDALDKVLTSIDIAEKTGAFPFIKVNAVLMRGVNDTEANEFVKWAIERKVDLRFIEFMPTQSNGWGKERYISESEFREKIEFDLIKDDVKSERFGPARRYRVEGYPGRVGFISAISHRFCKTCNRLRLTSSGKLIGCLFRKDQSDLSKLLKDGVDSKNLESHIFNLITGKGFRKYPKKLGAEYQPAMKTIGG